MRNELRQNEAPNPQNTRNGKMVGGRESKVEGSREGELSVGETIWRWELRGLLTADFMDAHACGFFAFFCACSYASSARDVTNVVDTRGHSTTYWYNYYGLVTAATNDIGQLYSRSYDIEDRITNSVDANGVLTTNAYDLLGRLTARRTGGIEYFGYSPAGMVKYTNQLGAITSYFYDAARRKIAETNGNQELTQFEYDYAGDLVKLTDGNNHSTKWGYDVYGRVTSKTNDSNNRILGYSYDAEGRLTNRWGLEKLDTAYQYDRVGNLTNVTYASSGSLVYSYDAVNRLTNMADAVGTTTFAYTRGGQLKSEDGPWDHDTVSYTYTNRMRTSMSLQQPGTASWSQTYGYDVANRLQTITSPAGTFTYSYHTGLNSRVTSSALVKKLLLPNGAFETNTFDTIGRLTSNTLKKSNGISPIEAALYTYDPANRRTDILSSEREQTFGYDAIGQLISDTAYESSRGNPRMNEQLSYAYDKAGNLQYRTNNTLVENFKVNNLNELTTNVNSGDLTVIGTTTSGATNVTVNGTTAELYADATFAATGMARVNTYAAVAADSKGRRDTNTINVNISTNVTFVYDGNGNMLSDGERGYTWNDENQLIAITATNKWQSTFAYDGKLRRRFETNCAWNGTTYVPTNVVRFVYDGKLPIQHRDANNHETITLTRGKDLNGSLSRAGGIGGLLAMTARSETPVTFDHSYYHSDANGNVTMLINNNQAVVAKYLFDAFGNTLSLSGSKALVNSYRFSSKPIHELSGLYDYLYRYYHPKTQRWCQMDPIQEAGGRNLFRFVRNSPTTRFDPWGLSSGESTTQEKIDCVRDCGAKAALKGHSLADKARNETRRRFPHASGEDDYADAFRHCYWACLMERELGAECAQKILDNHENAGDRAGQKEKSGEMDRQNNGAGLNLGEQQGDCGDLCDKALKDGTLVDSPSKVE
jgi:RHS repeat-associated protein